MEAGFAFELRRGKQRIAVRPAGTPAGGYKALLDGVALATADHPHEALGKLLAYRRRALGANRNNNCDMIQ